MKNSTDIFAYSANALRPRESAAVCVLKFWFEETRPVKWYRRDREFDDTCRRRFGAYHLAAAAHRLDHWRATPRGSLARIILLDQISRNIYRDDPRAYAADALAREVAHDAINRRFDALFGPRERAFFYMPFMHSEDLADQRRCVCLFKARMPASGNTGYAIEHYRIIDRFGRFPHRNKVLGRPSTKEERQFLAAGGFNP